MLLPYVLFCMSEVISLFRSLRSGSQVFTLSLIMLFLCVIFHTMSLDKSLQLLCIYLGCVVLVCHQYDVCENFVGIVYIDGYGGLSESGLCDLCPVSSLVVGECLSGLLLC